MLRSAAAAVTVLVLAIGGCTSSSGSSPGVPDPPSTAAPATTTTAPPPPRSFHLTGGIVRAPDPRMTTFPSDVVVGVQGALDRYLAQAVLAPLESGAPAGDLGALFHPSVRPRVAPGGPDRAALVDEGLPVATDVRVERAVADVGATANADGHVGVVLASIDLTVTGRAGGGDLTVRRTGELTLVPHEGAWLIDYYKMTAARDSRP